MTYLPINMQDCRIKKQIFLVKLCGDSSSTQLKMKLRWCYKLCNKQRVFLGCKNRMYKLSSNFFLVIGT